MQYNWERLRNNLTDEYSAAMFSGNPAALMDLICVEQASNPMLVEMATDNFFDLSKYKLNWE